MTFGITSPVRPSLNSSVSFGNSKARHLGLFHGQECLYPVSCMSSGLLFFSSFQSKVSASISFQYLVMLLAVSVYYLLFSEE